MVVAAITARLDGLALEHDNKRDRRRSLRPESGRRATRSVALGSTIASPDSEFGVDQPNLFATSIVFEFGAEGVIFSSGDATLGALVAVYDDELIIRAGGGALPPEDDIARLRFPVGSLGRGRLNRLAWYFGPQTSGPLIVRAWLNGEVLGEARSAIDGPAWSADAAGGFDALQAARPQEAEQVEQIYTAGGQAITGPLLNYLGVFPGLGGGSPELPSVSNPSSFGVSPQFDPSLVDVSGFFSVTSAAGESQNITVSNLQAGEYLYIFVPTDLNLTEITNLATTGNELPGFTKIDDAQDGLDAYRIGPISTAASGLAVVYRITFESDP